MDAMKLYFKGYKGKFTTATIKVKEFKPLVVDSKRIQYLNQVPERSKINFLKK